MAQQIFYLCRCDLWKSYSSMIPILMTTDENKLIETIKREISHGDMEYAGWDEDIDAAIQEFEEDWETSNRADINSKLDFGYYDYTEDGMEMEGF